MKIINHIILSMACMLAIPTAFAGPMYAGYELNESTNIVTGGGLEWLQWDETTGLSISDAISTYQTAGWRVANNTEIAVLLNSFAFNGFTSFDSVPSSNQTEFASVGDTGIEAFIDILGATFDTPNNREAIALFSENPFAGTGNLGYALSSDTGSRGGITDDGFTFSFSHSDIGVALVREASASVPEPAIFLLFATGILGLRIRPRRKRIH